MKNNAQKTKSPKNSETRNFSDEQLWLLTSVADDTHIYDVDKAFNRFIKRTHINSPTNKAIFVIKKWHIAAVAIFLLGFITLTAYWQGEKNIRNHFSNTIVEAPRGSKTKVQLPDGSSVWLNAESKIVYSQGFGVNNRKLQLTGEGYFEVKRNENIPFTIKTEDVDVTVLGTKFNFRNYKDENKAILNLLEGKVSLLSHLKPDTLKYLIPSEKMILNKRNGDINISTSEDAEESVNWTKNILYFNENLLSDIVKDLERNYNVQIKIINEKLKDTRFYGSFDQKKQNVYDILNMFSETGNLSYEEKNGIIYLK